MASKLSICIPLLVFSLIQTGPAAGGKVGIFVSTFANSQIIFAHRLAAELSRDHQVVLIQPELNVNRKHSVAPRIPRVREIHLQIFNDSAVIDQFFEREQRLFFKDFSILDPDLKAARWLFLDMLHKSCERMISDEQFMASLKAEQFDVLFVNHYDACPFGIARVLNVTKTVQTHSSSLIEMLSRLQGHSNPPSLVPGLLNNSTNQMTWTQRLENLVYAALLTVYTKKFESGFQAIFDAKYGQAAPSIHSESRRTKLLLVNDFEVLDYPRPTMSKLVYIGGLGMDLHPSSSQKLSPELESFLQSSQIPVVLVSLGSVTDSKHVPEFWTREFVKFFAQSTDFKFVWKFDDLHLESENVFVSKWVPQTELLNHDKVVGFIHHCGFNGLQEAVFAGKPSVCVPLFADQPRNAKLLEFRGLGKAVSKAAFSAEALRGSLTEIVNNPEYTESVLQLRKLIRNRPFNSSQLLRKWTTFVIENEFDWTPPDLDFVQYYNLDFLVPLAFIFLALASLLLKLLVSLYYWSCCTMAFKDKQKLQ